MAVINWRVLYAGLQKFIIGISDVTNSGNTAPSDPFSFILTSKDGIQIAANSGVETVTNDSPFTLFPSAFEAQPDLNELGAETNYRIAFFPETYIRDMTVKIKLPSQISFVDQEADIVCKSLSSNVDSSIQCILDSETGWIMISGAFSRNLFDSSQGIVFSIEGLKNPNSLQTTDSFEIVSLTEDGFLIDSRDSELVINFECLLPCRSCKEGSNSECSACFTDGLLTSKAILHESQCIETCPLSSVMIVTNEETTIAATYLEEQTCAPCFDSKCTNCSGPEEGLCSICSDENELIEGNCEEKKKQEDQTDDENDTDQPLKEEDKNTSEVEAVEDESFYLFPFALSTLLWAIISLILTRCVVKREKRIAYFLPMAISGIVLVSISMAIYDSVWLYPEKGLTGHAYATLVCAFGLPLFV